jgi:hypothetical protein
MSAREVIRRFARRPGDTRSTPRSARFTRRIGMPLGLRMSKRHLDEIGGEIAIESVVG